MDNSMYHNGTKVTNTLDKASVIRAPHAVYSPDLSPCDFSLFGMLTPRITPRQLQSPKEILHAVAERWDQVTFEQLQNLFVAWMERLQGAIQNGGEHVIN
jgi:hypothetical protein